jgi:hypothetical protein
MHMAFDVAFDRIIHDAKAASTHYPGYVWFVDYRQDHLVVVAYHEQYYKSIAPCGEYITYESGGCDVAAFAVDAMNDMLRCFSRVISTMIHHDPPRMPAWSEYWYMLHPIDRWFFKIPQGPMRNMASLWLMFCATGHMHSRIYHDFMDECKKKGYDPKHVVHNYAHLFQVLYTIVDNDVFTDIRKDVSKSVTSGHWQLSSQIFAGSVGAPCPSGATLHTFVPHNQ